MSHLGAQSLREHTRVSKEMCIFGVLKYVSCENNTLGMLAMSIRPENCFVASSKQVLALAHIILAVVYVSCNR